MFAQNLATITKLASDAACSLANLSTAGSTACDCGNAQCRAGPFQFLVAHPRQQPEEPEKPENLEPEPEPARLRTLHFGDIDESEVLLCICSFLPTKDLGRLACVSRMFGQKRSWALGAAADPEGGGDSEMRSVVEESAWRWVAALPELSRSEQPAPNWLRRKHELAAQQATAEMV